MDKNTRNYKAKAFLKYAETGEIQLPKDSYGIYKAVQK